MALKAGYIGVKKSLMGVINKLATAKIIKTVGDGLTLTSAGTLKAAIDSETMEIKDHKLAAKAKGANIDLLFSTDSASGNELVLSDDITNYDFVEIISVDGDYMVTTTTYCADIVKGTTKISGVTFDNQNGWYLVSSDGKTLTKSGGSSVLNVRKIYGVKL